MFDSDVLAGGDGDDAGGDAGGDGDDAAGDGGVAARDDDNM